jgi:hypothetical protein
MKNEQTAFLERLKRIEDHSRVMATELPPGFAKTRAVHILRTARDLKSRLISGSVAVLDLSATRTSSAEPAQPPT